jgi:2-keto-4-pentenoate hydratase
MNTRTATDILWEAWQRNEYFPVALVGQLDFQTALEVQLEMLARRMAAGARLAGWKIGLTSPALRAHFGTERQPFGYLLEEGVHPSGARISLARLHADCGLEPELCWEMAHPLSGPGATAEDARKAVGAVCPGMEINEKRSGGIKDFELSIADNLTQWGIVVGTPVSPVPETFDSDALRVDMSCNGEVRASSLGADVIDDHFESLARLANVLAGFDRQLEPGQKVITGSFSKHDVGAGEHWVAEFSGIGTCDVSFES